MAFLPQVLEIPGTRPSREMVFRMAESGIRNSPYAITRSERNRGSIFRRDDDCCPCGPGEQGMQAPAGLQQPTMPQKPFQPQGQDPCSYVDEALAKIGLTRELLCQCGKCGSRASSGRSRVRRGSGTRSQAAPRRRKRASNTGIRRIKSRKTMRGIAPQRAGLQQFERTGGRGIRNPADVERYGRRARVAPSYRWYPKTANRKRALCRDTANNLIVSKRFCGK